MSSCSNCFNGCADIVSDQCVKYTGEDIPGLGILNGDPLSIVEEKITDKLLEVITGEGIVPIITPGDLCSLVSGFLPVSGVITLNDVLSALIKSICNLDSRVTSNQNQLNILNANYTISCLTGVTASTDTHDIVQAIITKLCSTASDLTALSLNVTNNYVLKSDINSYIQAYIASSPTSANYNSKMIPYTAVPYFGPMTGIFDITGAGIGIWTKIYLCNGLNNTQDLRGRSLVGATTMGTNTFSPVVDPAVAGNPTYTMGSVAGTNTVSLLPNQLAPHTHIVTIAPTTGLTGQVQHISESFKVSGTATGVFTKLSGFSDNQTPHDTDTQDTGGVSIDVNHTHTVSVGTTGTGDAHNNIHPVLATNYIMYIP